MVVRDILRACLTAIDQDVYLAASGAEALDLAARMTPALVICDVNLPIMNGLEICERLRCIPTYSTTPIVVLTQHSDERFRQAAMKLGAIGFLSKPFRPADVLSMVARFLPIKPELLAKINRDNERAASIANRSARSPKAAVHAMTSGAELDQFDRGKRLLTILRS